MAKALLLFSGAGGSSEGVKRTNLYDSIIGYDNWPISVETHRANDMPAHVADLNHRMPKVKGEVDLIWASCPCQPFTNAIENDGHFDSRDGVPAYLRVLKKYRPRLTVFENVAGLSYKRHSNYLALVVRRIEELGYTVEWRILNAADYRVPQVRLRLILVGRLDGKPRFPAPSPHPRISVLEAVGDGSDNPPGTDVRYLKTPSFRQGFKGALLYNGRGRPLDLSLPSKTIYAAGGNHVHWFDTENQAYPYYEHLLAGGKVRTGQSVKGARRLTPEQMAILQGFPESYIFCGPPSVVVKQIGNAVPPRMAYAIVKSNQE